MVAVILVAIRMVGFGTTLERFSVSEFEKRSDFGQVGQSEVDYKRFNAWVADPDLLRPYVEEKRADLDSRRAKFDKRYPVPGADASEEDKAKYAERLAKAEKRWARRKEEVARLERNYELFQNGEARTIMPIYPHYFEEYRLDLGKNPPNKPSFALGIPLGTDMSGRDVVPLLLYGFRISLVFALVVAALGYLIGIVVGGIQGYYGGWIDIVSQRFVEIWSSIPFLFTIMIIASMITPNLMLLIVLLVILRSWIGITYYLRGEFYREKAKDYVQAAIGAGVSDRKIILGHILPNSLVPVVTFAPFGIVAYIGSLVSLDYLGFGLPPGTPSWGALLRQGLENVQYYPHLAIVPAAALALTLFCVVMIGEAVREAFDPKVFSRLR